MKTYDRREAMALAAMTSGVVLSETAFASDKTSPMQQIKSLDYTILFARDMDGMKTFYKNIMKFPLIRILGPSWIEFKVGNNILALTPLPASGRIVAKVPADGVASVQLAFRVPVKFVNECFEELKKAKVEILEEPKDQHWGHRTVFFKDPDGNILEIYAHI